MFIKGQRKQSKVVEVDNHSPQVSLSPDSAVIDAAIEMNQLLRAAKIEVPLRPKVVGAIVLALYEGSLSPKEEALASINTLARAAIEKATGWSSEVKDRLREVLYLSGADFSLLSPRLGSAVALLKKLNSELAMHTGSDVLGMFYEAFLRYGYDNNALGIVFTPRHITAMCVQLTPIEANDKIIDIACGTGGFLVSAFDFMLQSAYPLPERVEEAFCGFETNSTIWALATLNMFFRTGGKSRLFHADCLAEATFQAVRGKFSRAYLNPPFSQQGQPERAFIDRALQALEPGGILAAVVKASLFADDEHKAWRQQFLSQHSLRAVISLPEDIFYPTAVPSSLVIAQAHTPLSKQAEILLGRVWYDGYEKSKGRRVERGINQIPEIREAYQDFQTGKPLKSSLVTIVKGAQLANGREWSPQEWLAQPEAITEKELVSLQEAALRSIFQAISTMPELSSSVLSQFGQAWSACPPLPLHQKGSLERFFHISNGKSAGEKHYQAGEYPYISSGDSNNSIIRQVHSDVPEIFVDGGISVTAFGLARIQPWAFVARGNGGSSVRILVPRYSMSLRELLWFAAQINSQRWRFFYSRMAIKGRLARLKVWSPASSLPDSGPTIAERVKICQSTLDRLSRLQAEIFDETGES